MVVHAPLLLWASHMLTSTYTTIHTYMYSAHNDLHTCIQNALMGTKWFDQTTKLAPMALNLSSHLFFKAARVMVAWPYLLKRRGKESKKRAAPLSQTHAYKHLYGHTHRHVSYIHQTCKCTYGHKMLRLDNQTELWQTDKVTKKQQGAVT